MMDTTLGISTHLEEIHLCSSQGPELRGKRTCLINLIGGIKGLSYGQVRESLCIQDKEEDTWNEYIIKVGEIPLHNRGVMKFVGL